MHALSRPQCAASTLPATFGTTAKAEFSASEFATALGASLAAGSQLRAILVPRLTDTAEPAQTRMLSPAETQKLLETNCFTPRDEFWIRPWLVPRATPVSALLQHARQLTHHLCGVPCIEVRFGIRNSLDELSTTVAEAVKTTL